MSARPGRLVRPLSVVLLLALVAVGCGSSDNSSGGGGGATSDTADLVKAASGDPQPGGKLTFGTEAEVSGWNPTVDRWDASGTEIAVTVFDPLTAFDQDFNAKPYLAESLTPNADFTQWTVKLRSGVTFSNGSPLTSAAVKKSMDAFRAAPLTGAAAANVASVDVVDDLSFRVSMKQPWAAYPNQLTAQAGVVPAPEQLDSGTEASSRVPIGTGPFVMKEWIPDKSFSATKNPNYWRPGLPYLDEVVFTPIPDSSNRVSALQAGDINVMATSRNEDIKKLTTAAQNGELQLVRSSGELEENLVLINTTKAPMDDVRVRQAMAYAIDKNAFFAVTDTDPSANATGMFSPDSKWYSAEGQSGFPTFDLDKAKQLVQEYEAEKGPISFALGSTTDPVVIRSAQLLQAQFQEAGMDVEVKQLEQSTYITNAVTGDYVAQMWRQFGAPDPDGDYVWFIGENATQQLALNMARNQDPELDAALNDQRASNDVATRQKDWATIQQRQSADLPYLWLSHQPWVMAAGNTVRGLDSGTLPDGSPFAGLVSGVMKLTQFWFES